jgi:hypothetical protein
MALSHVLAQTNVTVRARPDAQPRGEVSVRKTMPVRLSILAGLACALIAAGAIGALASPPPAGSTLRVHLRFRVVHGTVDTNGPFSLITIGSGPGVVLDESTGRQVHLHVPSYCRSPIGAPILGDSWLMEDCSASRLALYSLAGRHWRSVTVAPGCRHFHGGAGSQCQPQAIGTQWIEFDAGSIGVGDVALFQNINTGALRRDPTTARTFPNLDSPTLAQRLCRPVRVPSRTFAKFAFEGPFVLLTDEGGSVLERCGTPMQMALSGPGPAVLGAGMVLWLPGSPRLIDGISLPDLQRFTVAPPRAANDLVYIQLGARHLYLTGSTRRNLSITWSAPLP